VAAEIATPLALDRLRRIHHAYVASGYDYLDHSTKLIKDEWDVDPKSSKYVALAQANRFVTRLPSGEISRRQVFQAFDDAIAKIEKMRAVNPQLLFNDALVAVMAWGFQPGSYGPWRTNEMLSSNNAKNLLREVYGVLHSPNGGPVEGYRRLTRKLDRMGPAFGTKFLYFASPEENRAPILDSVVANWLWRHGIRGSKSEWINPLPWKSGNYQRYIWFCDEVAADLRIQDRGLIEYLMFVDARYSDYLEAERTHPWWLTRSITNGWSATG
jgi:hypothetical protein